jgi:hypothetical protein
MPVLTKLDAVNRCLGAVGTAPISTLEGDLSTDVQLALQEVDHSELLLQARGWHFNTSYDVDLVRDGNGNIPVATNVLGVDINALYYAEDISLRDGKLFNHAKNTAVFDKDLKGTVTYRLAFDSMPVCAKACIAAAAALSFAGKTQPEYMSGQILRDEFRASMAELNAQEIRQSDRNAFQNISTSRVFSPLYRHRY